MSVDILRTAQAVIGRQHAPEFAQLLRVVSGNLQDNVGDRELDVICTLMVAAWAASEREFDEDGVAVRPEDDARWEQAPSLADILRRYTSEPSEEFVSETLPAPEPVVEAESDLRSFYYADDDTILGGLLIEVGDVVVVRHGYEAPRLAVVTQIGEPCKYAEDGPELSLEYVDERGGEDELYPNIDNGLGQPWVGFVTYRRNGDRERTRLLEEFDAYLRLRGQLDGQADTL